MNTRTPPPPVLRGPVRITVPASVAFNIDALTKSFDRIAERLGCRACFSGADCTFSLARDYAVDASLKLRPVAAPQDPIPSVPVVTVDLDEKVGNDLSAVKRVAAEVSQLLGCAPCHSGFDLRFQQAIREQRNLVVNDKLAVNAGR